MCNSNLKQKYLIQMKTMLDKNYAEFIDNFQITSSKKVWYINHSVLNHCKPDKFKSGL